MRAATPLDQPRAIGAARVSSKKTAQGSGLDGLRQSGALKLLFPKGRAHLEGIIINTAGGITGGDRFEIEASAGPNSHLNLTTQAAERAYRAQPGQIGNVTNTLSIAQEASLFWLPQETILYDQAALNRKLTVEMHQTSQFVMVEPVLFGRRAMGEDVYDIVFEDRVDIRRDGISVFKDGVSLRGDVRRALDRPAIGNGARAMASLVWVAPQSEGALEKIRSLIGSSGGASMLASDILVLRLLAEDGHALRRSLVPVLDLITKDTLPLSWRL